MKRAQQISENAYAKFCVADGILFWTYKPQVVITLKVAYSVVENRVRFQKNRAFPILCDIRGVVGVEKAGRNYLAQYGSSLATAVAIWADQTVLDSMSSFYVTINKPRTPTKIFTCRTEALNYLNQFK